MCCLDAVIFYSKSLFEIQSALGQYKSAGEFYIF